MPFMPPNQALQDQHTQTQADRETETAELVEGHFTSL